MEDNTALTLYDGSTAALYMVRPLVDADAARAAIVAYEKLKQAIVQPGDVQKIQGRDFLKKSFWRRVATCFGLSLELVSEARGFDEGNRLYYSVVYRAVAPNGRSMIGDGYCSTAEKGREAWPEHNVRATAHTRAKNRAISDLVGGGEVSAEELPDYDDAPPTQPTRHDPQAYAARTIQQGREMTAKMAKGTATTTTAPAKPAAEGKTPPTWESLRLRGVKAGIAKQEDWEAVCQQYAGTTDPAKMTIEGKTAIVRYIKHLEALKADAEAHVVDADAASGVDLADLPPVAMVP